MLTILPSQTMELTMHGDDSCAVDEFEARLPPLVDAGQADGPSAAVPVATPVIYMTSASGR